MPPFLNFVSSSYGDILLGVFIVLIFFAMFIGYCYAFFLLIDSEKWYYQLVAVIITGLFGAGILLGLRWLYRKIIEIFTS